MIQAQKNFKSWYKKLPPEFNIFLVLLGMALLFEILGWIFIGQSFLINKRRLIIMILQVSVIGIIAVGTLRIAGSILASWKMLLSLEKASNAVTNNASSAEFLKEKASTVKHFIDFILPRYLSNFTTISASTE